MINLTKINGETVNDVTFADIKAAFLELYRSHGRITLMNDSELALEIYQNTVVLQDYGHFKYDGPGGPGELLTIRVEEGSLLPVLEEAVELLDGYEIKKLIQLLNSLPRHINADNSFLLEEGS